MGSFTETSGDLELNPGGRFSSWQQFVLVLSRFCVGWHLFYQGLGKLQAAHWSAEGYLKSATGPLSSQFSKLAANAAWMALADRATIWGLMIAGVLLMLGLFTRLASVGAILLLLLFYLAHPPFPVHGFGAPTINGFELYVNQVLIEILVIVVCLAFRTERISGLDMLLHDWRQRRKYGSSPEAKYEDSIRVNS